jgi:uncharacterized damage-inducible protein DinB
MTEKDHFVFVAENEHRTLLKLLKEFPAAKANFKPAEKSRSAKDLAWTFVQEQGVCIEVATKGAIEFDKMPKAPATWEEIMTGLEASLPKMREAVSKMSETDYNSMMDFFTGPGQMGKFRRADVLWMFMFDLVHHRGQFSVYNRIVGAKVPSIYGPSADDPWM